MSLLKGDYDDSVGQMEKATYLPSIPNSDNIYEKTYYFSIN